MDENYDIYKAAGIIIVNRKLLVERSKGKNYFVAPGGEIEKGETPKQALVRELLEEFKIITYEEDFEEFGTFYADAAGQESKRLRMDVFFVKRWQGEPTPDSEVEELAYVSSLNQTNYKIGSIFSHDVIPPLVELDLID